ncbi:Cell cycle control protein, partial [Operophtera brumata]
MRTAALPTFRKLYRRVDHSQVGFITGLMKGAYELNVEYKVPTLYKNPFLGVAYVVVGTLCLLLGIVLLVIHVPTLYKNPFLGVAYVVVGTLCLLLGIVLLVIHVKCSK